MGGGANYRVAAYFIVWWVFGFGRVWVGQTVSSSRGFGFVSVGIPRR